MEKKKIEDEQEKKVEKQPKKNGNLKRRHTRLLRLRQLVQWLQERVFYFPFF